MTNSVGLTFSVGDIASLFTIDNAAMKSILKSGKPEKANGTESRS